MPNERIRLCRRLILAVALVGSLAWAVAPAFSLDRYEPAATDFEQALPPLQRVERRGIGLRSPVIEAPGRFDLVGVGGETRPLELRARPNGEGWSEWIEIANGDPVYFGGADELQLRTPGFRPKGPLHYVNVSGTASAGDRLVTAARRAVNSALISVASVPGAGAAPPAPSIVSRAEWGAERRKGGCEPRSGPLYGRVKAATVHHTVIGAKPYTPEEAPRIVLGICRYHRNGNGWSDVGYNALVDAYGTIYEGRAGGIANAVVGAHAQGFNSQTTGVAVVGDHSSQAANPEAIQGVVRFLAWKLHHHGVPARGTTRLVSAGGSLARYPAGRRVKVNRILGHRRVNRTECPGDALKSQLETLRRKTGRAIKARRLQRRRWG